MATKLDKLKFDLHQKKYKMLLIYGLSKGLIFPYDDELIEDLEKYIMEEFLLLLFYFLMD